MLEELANSGVMDRKIKYNQASEKVMRILADQGMASEMVLAELARIDHERADVGIQSERDLK